MKKRIIAAVVILLLLCALSMMAAYNLHMAFSGQRALCSANPVVAIAGLAIPQVRLFLLFGIGFSVLFVYWILTKDSHIKYKNGMKEIVPGVFTPEAYGQGQHGTARWLGQGEYEQVFSIVTVDKNAPLLKSLMSHGRDDLKEHRHD